MSGTPAKAAPAAKPNTPSFTPVMVYGIVADVLCIIPIILYMVLAPTSAYAKYHQTMINMLVSAWMPFGITWIIAIAADGDLARAGLTGALSMAGLGPFALQWVGLMSFIMAAHSAGMLGKWENLLFTFLYLAMNIGMVVMHWFLAKGVAAWIASPLPVKKAAPKPAAKKAASSDASW